MTTNKLKALELFAMPVAVELINWQLRKSGENSQLDTEKDRLFVKSY